MNGEYTVLRFRGGHFIRTDTGFQGTGMPFIGGGHRRGLRMTRARSETHGSYAGEPDFTTGADMSDLRLVRYAQSGEVRAFDRLVRKYRPRIVELAVRRRLSPADAEDATQETFIRAFRGLPGFRCESAFYTWLHRIAFNCCSRLLKRRARDSLQRAYDLPLDQSDEASPARLQELETPEKLLLTEEIRVMVDATLAMLSEEQRTVIALREIDGLSYKQIAAAMRIPLGTVRSRVFRARDHIDHQLRGVYDGGLGRQPVQRLRESG
jgi:RNA polymerase sigma-70 factor, ECF subfamily